MNTGSYTINQFGEKSIFIEKHEGDIFISDKYSVDAKTAFEDGSFELMMYQPSIQPPIKRPEVDRVFEWISSTTDTNDPQRVGVLYGKAGIGKSVVMHDLLEKLQGMKNWQVLGLKSDQIEFTDTDDLSKQLHLVKRLEDVIQSLSESHERVVLLIDQIDALSLSLSTNRTPLRSLLKLIQKVQRIENVRVVISCRPYDLEYDPTLELLRIKNKWELKEFAPDIVTSVLKDHGYEKSVGGDVVRFLGNPLHLHLFLKVFRTAQLRFPLTEEDLYDQLWKKFLIEETEEKVDKARVIKLLDVVVNHMYEKQELTIRRVAVETEFSNELNYLLHSEILTQTPTGLLQFFHQTMFDYVFARRFNELGKDILDELCNNHQGLFIRSAVKSIMTFKRASDPKSYISALNHLLFDRAPDGCNIYRFHIRSLILSSMVFFEEPIQEELALVEFRLLKDETMFCVMLDAINNEAWFEKTLSIIWKHYTWRGLSNTIKDKIIGVGRRIVWLNTNVVLDFANIILDQETEGDKQRVSNMLDSYDLNGDSKKIIEVYNRITTSRCPQENTTILKSLCKYEPVFVMGELRENVKIQLQNQERTYLTSINLNHFDETIYEELEATHPELTLGFYLELFELILEKESFLIDSHDISYSIEFSHFRRCKNTHFAHDFVDTLLNKILDRLESDIEAGKDYHESLLLKLATSSYDGIVFIALSCYTKAPEHYLDTIYKLLNTRKLLANAPSWVEYQSAELVRVSFPLFSKDQKDGVISLIMNIYDKGEWTSVHKRSLEERLQFNIPLLWVDNRKGTLLNLLDKDCLKNEYRDAYMEFLRIRRKYPHDKQLLNEEPYRSSSMCGYPSMRREKAEKMNNETWKVSMRAYNSDASLNWDRPSLSGQQMLLQEQTNNDPEGKFNLLMDVVHDDTIMLSYPIAGLKGLIESGRIDLATKLFDSIVAEVGEDINRDFRNYNLHSFLFAIDGFVKATEMPKSVFDFICRATIEAEEDLTYRGKDGKDLYNRGINQPRGNAAYKLIECSTHREWAEDIFRTLESIALTASEFTRASILLNFAALNFLDKERSLKVFLMLMHDYHPALMSMPVHSYNPLVYYVNYAFDELIPFFEKALEIEDCHEQQVIILWLAWNHTHKPKAKEILDAMCEATERSRLSLTAFLSTLEGNMTEEPVDYLCRFMQEKYYSEEIAEKCDSIFHNLENVTPELQYRLADNFVNSKLCEVKNRSFYNFLASYALSYPQQTLEWLNIILQKDKTLERKDYNIITDIIIQSYNGIKSFCDDEYMPLLEKSMDLLDELMQRQDKRYAITNFIYKLDNE